MRTGIVKYNNELAGILTEEDSGEYVSVYDESYGTIQAPQLPYQWSEIDMLAKKAYQETAAMGVKKFESEKNNKS